MTDNLNPSLIQPTDFRLPPLSPRVFLFFMLNHFHRFHEMVDGSKIKSYGPAKRFNFTFNQAPCSALGGFIGAPLAAIILENAIASGGKSFHAFGTAGWLGKQETPIGKMIQPTFGIDETGIVKDYDGIEKRIQFAPIVSDNKQIGTVSVNSFYRLTAAKLDQYRQQQIDLIEMESVPLQFIATQKGATYQPVFVISDGITSDNLWKNGSISSEFNDGLNQSLNQLPLLAEQFIPKAPA